MIDQQTPNSSVRQARFDLAQALLAENLPRRDEAVAQLKLATDEAGDQPPTWRLLACAAQSLVDTDPAAALEEYLRCFRYSAPDDLAQQVREWVERQAPGTLRTPVSAVDRLTRPGASPGRVLLAARVYFALGKPAKSYETLGDIDDSDPSVGPPRQELEARCLIELGKFEAAANVIDERRRHALGDRRILLKARLAFATGRFDDALAQLDAYPGQQSDELDALRILALVGAGKAEQVRWETPGPFDRTGSETWLSRAVAALEAGRYKDAREAAEWAERDQPASLSVQLLKAQARLEADDFAAGHAMLKIVAGRAVDRGRDPYWLERQHRIGRRFGRFGYLYCEFLHLCQRTDLDLVAKVERAETTYRQDGRLDEIEAGALPVGSAERVAALDRAAIDYTNAGAGDLALEVAQQAYTEGATFPRAVALGWAVYSWSFASERADGGVPADAGDRLDKAIAAVESMLPEEHEQLSEAVWLVAAARTRLVQLLTSGGVQAGIVASGWALANAALRTDDPTAQVMVEQILRFSFELSPASMEFAEYAAALDDSMSTVTESRLIARLNEIGVDDEVLRLLDLLERQEMALPEDGFTLGRRQWRNAVRLHLALLTGDPVALQQAVEADIGTEPWVLERKALALIRLSVTSLRPFVESVVGALPANQTTELPTRARLAALAGDYDSARALLARSREQGNVPASNLDTLQLVFDYLADGTQPLAELVAKGMDLAPSPAEVLWWENVWLPWLSSVISPDMRSPDPDLDSLFEARRVALAHGRLDWPDQLDAESPLLGALALLWRATVRRDATGMLNALRTLPKLDCDDSMRIVLAHLARKTAQRIPEALLATVVENLAEDREPDRALVEEIRGETTCAVVELTASLIGVETVDLTDKNNDTMVQAFGSVMQNCTDPAGIWRVHAAIAAAPGLSEHRTVLTDVLLDQLSSLLGLDTVIVPQLRSHVSFELGYAFVPEDTGPDWVLFSTYIPALQARIEMDRGYVMPGFNVRLDATSPGSLHLQLHETIFESLDLPFEGSIALVAPQPPWTVGSVVPNPLEQGWAVHVPPQAQPPADTIELWEPLEFAMWHVERFVRAHLADIVTVWDAVGLALQSDRTAEEPITDPAVLRQWLVGLRSDLDAGDPGPASTWAQAIADRLRPQAAVSSGAGG
jgi:tetratricopeptide (TPR) repeat protein